MKLDTSLLEPFWASPIMRNESLFLIERSNGGAQAQLIFSPDRVLSLTSAGGDVEYERGRDYEVSEALRTVTRLPGSSMPFTTAEELYPAIDPDGSRFMHRRDRPDAFLMCGDDGLFHRRQVSISYSHAGDRWKGPVPHLAGALLAGTLQKLIDSKPLTVCLTGDSISEGYNSSGFLGMAPYQPSFGPLVMAGLERAYRSPITFHNLAVAGWTADDGLPDADRVAAAKPDLVIVAYGMNDAGYATAEQFATNIDGILSEIRRHSSCTEFILVSPMLPHSEWHYTVFERFPAYRDLLAQRSGPGVAFADVTTLWSHLLTLKSTYDLSGNGINHPNDFGHRLYAQAILALLTDGTDQTRSIARQAAG